MPKWLRYFLSGLAAIVALLACAGAIYEQIGRRRDSRAAIPGQMIDVGGYRMHIVCQGRGSPAVILDAGLGNDWLIWAKVQPDVARFTRVCAYDRAGMGFSDPSPRPRTSQVIAEELHMLLSRSGVEAPYIVAGHSFGGFNVRLFAALYRSEVAGMLLVDSSHPGQMQRLPAQVIAAQNREDLVMRIVPYLLPFGLVRYSGACGDDALSRRAQCRAEPFRESLAELSAFEESAAEVRAAPPLGNLPVIVLSHDHFAPMSGVPPGAAAEAERVWSELQQDLTRISSRSRREVVRGATHYIQTDRPDVVIAAIRELWSGR